MKPEVEVVVLNDLEKIHKDLVEIDQKMKELFPEKELEYVDISEDGGKA